MNKTQFINLLSEETSFSKRDITRVVDGMFRIMTRELKKGNRIQWSGFGTFSVANRAARDGINPVTGQRIKVPERRVLKFKAGKKVKEAIQSLLLIKNTKESNQSLR